MGESTEERIEMSARLENAGKLLVKLAEAGKIGPIYERKEYVDKCWEYVLAGNNLLLVGENGVGKNAIVESIAIRLAKENPFSLEILETNVVKLLEGCLYIGNLENKIALLVKNCVENNTILFVDNIHFGIGVWSGGAEYADLINILYNSLLPDSRVIVTTTPEGLKVLQKIHPNFVNKFIIVEVPPTSPEETKKILKELKPKIEEKYSGISIQEDLLIELVRLADAFYHWRQFPGKAFEILFRMISLRMKGKLNKEDLYEFIQKEIGLPELIIREDYALDENDVKNYFKRFIFEQNEAIEEITDTILRFKTGLNNPKKPAGTFLFAGPSGVGKTELAKILALYLFGSKEKLFIYPMAQYRGDYGFKVLFGDSGSALKELGRVGKLLKDVKATPFSVILLDEIDQASVEIFNALYQILDEGRYIDNNGDVTSFKSTIIIMTTNIGMEKFYTTKPGFGDLSSSEKTSQTREGILKELENYFKLPFLNRIEKIIIFNPLDKETVKMVVKKAIQDFTRELQGLRVKNLKIDCSDNVIDFLAEKGYNEKYGARNVQKIVEHYLIKPIASYVAKNPDIKNKIFSFRLSGEKIDFELK
jgi:ATP-dependent Clp protease ATP-binding subunit ClpA